MRRAFYFYSMSWKQANYTIGLNNNLRRLLDRQISVSQEYEFGFADFLEPGMSISVGREE